MDEPPGSRDPPSIRPPAPRRVGRPAITPITRPDEYVAASHTAAAGVRPGARSGDAAGLGAERHRVAPLPRHLAAPCVPPADPHRGGAAHRARRLESQARHVTDLDQQAFLACGAPCCCSSQDVRPLTVFRFSSVRRLDGAAPRPRLLLLPAIAEPRSAWSRSISCELDAVAPPAPRPVHRWAIYLRRAVPGLRLSLSHRVDSLNSRARPPKSAASSSTHAPDIHMVSVSPSGSGALALGPRSSR